MCEREVIIEAKNVKFSYYYGGETATTAATTATATTAATTATATTAATTATTATAEAAATAESSKTDVDERRYAVDDVTLNVMKGEFLVIIGRNGSGKSTLVKLFNALLFPSAGTVSVKGMSSLDEKNIWDIRRIVGMVFQNPDNQIVGTTVEEDVAFGVENLGVEPKVIRQRINDAMKSAGVYDLIDRPPYQLSGGQKQRVAIAGILAMKPKCVILDEATAMLDPDGRKEVLSIVRELNKKESISVILVTHHMDEVKLSDRVIVMEAGRIAMEGTPKQLFSDVGLVRNLGLEAPEITELFDILEKKGICLPKGVTDVDEAFNLIMEYYSKLQ